MSELLQLREEHGFQRTECGCAFCQAPCRHIPGGLDPSDLPRLCPAGQDVFTWAELHLRALTQGGFPTLVPARHREGHCHWYFQGQCAVHEYAPYGCAFFDSHMSQAEVQRRYGATVQARQQDAAAGGLYYRVWLHLCRKGLMDRPGDRDAVILEVSKIQRNARRSRCRQERSEPGSPWP